MKNLLTRSIRTKLLIVICVSYVLSTAIILCVSIAVTRQIINAENETAYANQLEVILRTLQKRHDKLITSGMEGLFAEGYKRSTAKELGALHYRSDQQIYPYIIDETGRIVLHPDLEPGSLELAPEDFIRKMLAMHSGVQTYHWRGEEKWMVFRTFEPWHWTIGYAISAENKNAGISKAVQGISLVMALSSLMGMAIVYGMLSRMISPLKILSKDARIIGDGQYDHRVTVVNSRDEVAQLAASLSAMAANIRDRDQEIRKLNEQLEQRVRERTAALEASEQRFRDVALSSADWIWEVDRNGTFTHSYGRIEKIMGYGHDRVMGKPFDQGILADEADRIREIFIEAGRKGQAIVDVEIWGSDQDGNRVCIMINGVPIYSKEGKLLGYRGINKNITDPKQYEHQLKEAKEAAEAASIAKSEFLANMSHEIRTPMNGIIGMSGLLAETNLEPEQIDFVQTIQSSADGLLSIINDILDFSKIEAGKLEFEILNFNLHREIEGMSEMLAMKAHDKGLEFAMVLDPAVPQFLKGDPGRLRQVLLNLISNAIKFTEQGEVVIRVGLEKETPTQAILRFNISDTGIGIPEKRRNRLFKPFSQVDASTTRTYGGTGLGLAISCQLVDMMKGCISVESREGRGSIFWFTAEFEKQQEPESQTVIPPEDIEGKRVLVVDDHAVNREILCSYLSNWKCKIKSVPGAHEALESMQRAVRHRDPFDLAIIDHMMPGMDGEELALSIKANSDLSRTKLIMLTSRGLHGDAVRAKQLGYDAWLTKPVKRKKLLESILAIFGHCSGESHPACGDHPVRPPITKESPAINARIMVAEDNIVNQKVALNILSKSGYRADAVANGRAAVDEFKAIPYDLILMDVQMPVLDGIAATREIRAMEKEREAQSSRLRENDSEKFSAFALQSSTRVQRIPIIAMTANAMKGDRQRCLEAGMDDYLAKPVKPEQLIAKINKWVSAGGREVETKQLDQPVDVQAYIQKNEAAAFYDFKNALNCAMGDVSFLESMLSEFRQNQQTYFERINAAVANQDPVKLKFEAHSLKGASANLGLKKIQTTALALERMGDSRNLSEAASTMKELKDNFQHFDDYLDNLDWNTIADQG